MYILLCLIVSAATTTALAVCLLCTLRLIEITRRARAERRWQPTPPTITLG